MKNTTLSVLALAFVALLITPFAAVASSGPPPTITIEPASADPGSAIEVIGLDFPANAAVELQIGSSAGPLALGVTATDESGYFRGAVTLPADLAPGTWEVRVTAADGSFAAATFDVGVTTAATAPGAVAVTSEAAPASGNSGADIAFMIVIAFLIAAVVGGAALAWHLVREETLQPGMATGDDPIWSSGDVDERDMSPMVGDDQIWGAAHSE